MLAPGYVSKVKGLAWNVLRRVVPELGFCIPSIGLINVLNSVYYILFDIFSYSFKIETYKIMTNSIMLTR